MARYSLLAHPDHPPLAVQAVEVVAYRATEGGLWLEYSVRSNSALVLPTVQSPSRADGLWTTTCFELFWRPEGSEGYREFNFSPSFQWAAYSFDGYRAGGSPLPADDPEIEITLDADPFFFLAAEPWPLTLVAGEGLMGLSAVIEEEGGVLSYWALAHPPGAPDFHHATCFAATLPPPATP